MNQNELRIKPTLSDQFESNIQKAIIKCSDNGGGKIVLEPGIHKSTPIKLESYIELFLEEGAQLIFSNNFFDYKPVFTRWEGTECYALQSMIYAENCENIIISGAGTIDGFGDKWWREYKNIRNGLFSLEVREVQVVLGRLNAEITAGSGGGGSDTDFLRPSLVQFKSCKNITLRGVTLKDSPFWNTHILYSENVHLINLKFISPSDAPNTDGLDIDSSSNITVDNCFFNVGDDCLCLKSGMDADGIRVGKSTHHVEIFHCNMHNGHGGIVIGSETSGGIHNIEIRDCIMTGTDRGIRVKTRRGRGGIISNINIENIKMDNVICPIVINMYYRCGADEDNLDFFKSLDKQIFSESSTPVIENITVNNLSAVNVKSSAAFFYGLPESLINNLTLSNITVQADSEAKPIQPAMDFFNTIPGNYSVFIKNVENLTSSDIRVSND